MQDIINLDKDGSVSEVDHFRHASDKAVTISSSEGGTKKITSFQQKDKVSPLDMDNKSDKNRHTNYRQPRGIVGIGHSSKLAIKGIKLLGHVHICKLDPNLTEDCLKDYLNNSGFKDVQCIKLQSRRPEEYSSFRISVPREDLELLKKPEIWPEGSRINPFLFRLDQKYQGKS
ncbi:hypothetical protein WA026_011239 [Henosepilachna vigintioctopunctata]|uniref:Uncharacterized protein n=1 Tax=Henosepilachna vigintioctopunctata TaxID=420089 RepID=A0AAW1U7B5_9CUCU